MNDAEIHHWKAILLFVASCGNTRSIGKASRLRNSNTFVKNASYEPNGLNFTRSFGQRTFSGFSSWHTMHFFQSMLIYGLQIHNVRSFQRECCSESTSNLYNLYRCLHMAFVFYTDFVGWAKCRIKLLLNIHQYHCNRAAVFSLFLYEIRESTFN